MELKKALLSTLAMAAFFIGALALFMFVACSTPAPKSETQPQEQPSESTPDTPEIVVAVEEPEPIIESPSSVTSALNADIPASSSSSYSNYSDDSDDDYWAEKRKHSPNDNYLLGFDEDVDDVHDMELYMDDY